MNVSCASEGRCGESTVHACRGCAEQHLDVGRSWFSLRAGLLSVMVYPARHALHDISAGDMLILLCSQDTAADCCKGVACSRGT